MEGELDISGDTQEATGEVETREVEDSDGSGDGSWEVERESERSIDGTTKSDLANGPIDGDGDGLWEVERESERGIDTSTPIEDGSGDGDGSWGVERESEKGIRLEEVAKAEGPRELRELERSLEEESSEEERSEEESEGQEERVLPKDGSGESREPAIQRLGGHTDSESTDGDTAEECQETKVTGTWEDTLILERNSELETGKLPENTGENLVLKKEETSWLTET